jgi:hypothetical protein
MTGGTQSRCACCKLQQVSSWLASHSSSADKMLQLLATLLSCDRQEARQTFAFSMAGGWQAANMLALLQVHRLAVMSAGSFLQSLQAVCLQLQLCSPVQPANWQAGVYPALDGR